MQFAQKSRSLPPLDRVDGLGREVVTHAADAGDLGGDVGGDALEQWPCAVESSGSAGQQSRPSSLRRRTGHGPTRDLEMSGGFRTFFNGWRFLNLLESRIDRMVHVYPPLIHA